MSNISSLSAFLNPVEVGEKEVVISERFMENGKPVPWKIRPVTQEENKAIIKKHTKRNKRGEQEFDRVGYTLDLAIAGIAFPDLNNAELQKGYGVIGPQNLLCKMLYVGEYGRLSQEVQRLSGLEDDINEDIEEVKNE